MRPSTIALIVGCSVGLTALGQDPDKPTGADVNSPMIARAISLDGNDWLLATDREKRRSQAAMVRQPRDRMPNGPKYRGSFKTLFRVIMALRGIGTLQCPANPHAGGRYLLRFWAVDYLADVWLNGKHVGGHENGETPFVLDVTDAINAQCLQQPGRPRAEPDA